MRKLVVAFCFVVLAIAVGVALAPYALSALGWLTLLVAVGLAWGVVVTALGVFGAWADEVMLPVSTRVNAKLAPVYRIAERIRARWPRWLPFWLVWILTLWTIGFTALRLALGPMR